MSTLHSLTQAAIKYYVLKLYIVAGKYEITYHPFLYFVKDVYTVLQRKKLLQRILGHLWLVIFIYIPLHDVIVLFPVTYRIGRFSY